MSRQAFATYATLSNTGRVPLVRDEAGRRRALRRLTRVAGSRLLLFALADDHLHVVIEPVGPPALHLLACIEQALIRGEELPPLDDRLVKQVYTRSYLQSLVRYHCVQGEHHGLPGGIHWSGGCLLDLLGARCLPGFDRTWMERLLPRMDERALTDLVGIPPLAPFSWDEVVEPERLVAAGATLIARDLLGRSREVVQARRAVLQLAQRAYGDVGPVARALGLDDRNLRRHLSGPVPDPLEQALRRLLSVRWARTPA